MKNEILRFQRECYATYIRDIRKTVPEIPDPYVYPDRNSVKPVMPVKTARESIMVIGAFPFARYEIRYGLLIPVADNLSPFASEEYFDGANIRTNISREWLDRDYFHRLDINVDEIWLTNLVKVFLFNDKLKTNCEIAAPGIKFANTYELFPDIAKASMKWMKKEISICNPKLIITLGEIPAKVISDDFDTSNEELLNGEVRNVIYDRQYKIAHLGHPEIQKMSIEWNKRYEGAISRLAEELKSNEL